MTPMPGPPGEVYARGTLPSLEAHSMHATASTRRRPATALLAVLALVLAACGAPSDPGDALSEAFEATFADSLVYELSLEADSGVLTELAEDQGQVAALLGGVSLGGVVDGESASVRIEGLGSTLLELRSLDEGDTLYARLGVRDLLAMAAGGDVDPAALLALSGAADLPEDVREVLTAALEGQWVAIEGGLDRAVRDGASEADLSDQEIEAREIMAELLGGDLSGFLDRYVTVAGEDRGDAIRTIEVTFELREFLRAASELEAADAAADAPSDLEAELADLPETIPGVVEIRDGLVTELRFSLAEPLREAGAEVSGALDLVLELSDHGEVDPVVAPEGAVSVDADQLGEALGTLGRMGGGVLP